jgi:hypothetical protein
MTEPAQSRTCRDVRGALTLACAALPALAAACGAAEGGPADDLDVEMSRNRMDAAERTTCWIRTDGTLQCHGALLRGVSDPADGAFVKVAVGGDVTCGLREDGVTCFVGWIGCGAAPCWLGGAQYDRGPGGDVRLALPGRYRDLDLEPDGHTLWVIDGDGALSRHRLSWHVKEIIDGDPVELPAETAGTREASAAVRIAVTSFQACTLDARGAVRCWQIANPIGYYAPAGRFLDLAAGANHLCALPDGNRPVHCWGLDESGQSADVAGPFSSVSAGTALTCGLDLDDQAHCWGDGARVPVPGPAGPFVALAAGGSHACGLREDDTVECWGFGAGLPGLASASDVERPIFSAVDGSCVRLQNLTRFDCEMQQGYLSSLGLVKVNATAFEQIFGAVKRRNVWIAAPVQEIQEGGSTADGGATGDGTSTDALSLYAGIDPDDSEARLAAPIPPGTTLLHENPGGDTYELMTKLPPGAAPENGDWGFARYHIDGTRLPLIATSSGGYGGSTPQMTCLECHEIGGRRERTDLLWGIPRSAMP